MLAKYVFGDYKLSDSLSIEFRFLENDVIIDCEQINVCGFGKTIEDAAMMFKKELDHQFDMFVNCDIKTLVPTAVEFRQFLLKNVEIVDDVH